MSLLNHNGRVPHTHHLLLVLSTLFFAHMVVSLENLVVSTPLDVVTCTPVDLEWTGGTAPYIASVTCFGVNALGDASTVETELVWDPATVYAGCSPVLLVVDSLGNTGQSASFPIQAGTGSSCSDDISENITPSFASSTPASTSSSTSANAQASSGRITSTSEISSSGETLSSSGTPAPASSASPSSPPATAPSSPAMTSVGSSGAPATKFTSSLAATASGTPPPSKKKAQTGVIAAAVVVPVAVVAPTIVLVFCWVRRRRVRREAAMLSPDAFVSSPPQGPRIRAEIAAQGWGLRSDVPPSGAQGDAPQMRETQAERSAPFAPRTKPQPKRDLSAVGLERRRAGGEVQSAPSLQAQPLLPAEEDSSARAETSDSSLPAASSSALLVSSMPTRRPRVQEQDGGVRLAGGPMVMPADDDDRGSAYGSQYSTLPPPYADFDS